MSNRKQLLASVRNGNYAHAEEAEEGENWVVYHTTYGRSKIC